jgi:hypothetical protein
MTEPFAIVDKTFLLDTSALYSLSGNEMKSLCDKGISLYGSPYSCWELLCHLDEPNNFLRMKAILLKFQYLEILDSPQSEIEDFFFGRDHSRTTEDELIKACLAPLQAENSLDECYSFLIRDPKGNHRQIKDVSRRAREILDELELNYIAFASKLIEHLKTRSDIGDPNVHVDLILSLVLGEYNKLKEGHPSIQLSGEEVIRYFYVYCGYIFYRSVWRIERGGQVKKNDYKDANLCKHLRTNSTFHPVTDDDGILDALQRLTRVTECDRSLNPRLDLRVYRAADLKQFAHAG